MSTMVTVAALTRVAMYATVLILTYKVRGKHWAIGAACLTAIGANVALVNGDDFVSALFAMPFAGLNAYIYIDRMRFDPQSLRSLLGSKEAAWSSERHGLVNELAAERAKVDVLERRLQVLLKPE